MSDLSPEQTQKILELINERRMIEAIAKYRLFTNVGLHEAKEAVTTMFHDSLRGDSQPVQRDE